MAGYSAFASISATTRRRRKRRAKKESTTRARPKETTEKESPSRSRTAGTRPKRTAKKESPSTSRTTGTRHKQTAKKESPSTSRSTGARPKRTVVKDGATRKKNDSSSSVDEDGILSDEEQENSSSVDCSSSERNESIVEAVFHKGGGNMKVIKSNIYIAGGSIETPSGRTGARPKRRGKKGPSTSGSRTPKRRGSETSQIEEESTTGARPKRTAKKAHVLSPALPRKKKAVFDKGSGDVVAGGNFESDSEIFNSKKNYSRFDSKKNVSGSGIPTDNPAEPKDPVTEIEQNVNNDVTQIPATPHVTVTADRANESTDIPSHVDKNEDVFNIEAELELLELKLGQGWERKTNKTIGPEGGVMELPNCSLKIPTGAIEAKEDIGIATCSQPEDFPSNLVPIGPVLKGSPEIKFKESVIVSMETWYTARENEEILAKIMHRDKPGQAWTSQGEIALTTVNRVEFSISHFSDTVLAVSDDTAATAGEHHMINDVYIHQGTGTVVSIFFRDQKCNEEQQKILESRKYTAALAIPEEICVHYGSTILLRVRCEKPKGIKIAEGIPRPQLEIDVRFLQKNWISTYFKPTGNSISHDDYPLCMDYEMQINQEEPLHFPLIVTWLTETTSSTNEIHAINVAVDGGHIKSTSKRQKNKIKVTSDKRRKVKE